MRIMWRFDVDEVRAADTFNLYPDVPRFHDY
jgi:hypothetical protein